MSQENVEIVRRVFEADARRDRVAVFNLYDPDVEWDYSHGPGGDLFGRHLYRGHDGLRAFFHNWSEAFRGFGFRCQELIDAGHDVISVDVAHGHGRASGTQVEMRQWAVWSIRRGRIVRVVWFRTREEALEAAGPSE
jgi:ketosteroid isomerase-like protein